MQMLVSSKQNRVDEDILVRLICVFLYVLTYVFDLQHHLA